ncbi:organic solute transporter Ostalpha-domain-containing protein [Gautieria morchelliformis]|nr:organic solute transporter Ostalpha-domain-containing protein [Gautieria morchelliformis]
MSNSTGCPSINVERVQQSQFWSKGGIHWDQHRIGWAVSGGCAFFTVGITLCSVMSHALDYRSPAEQRQIIRILYMPPIFGIMSFLSYRFFLEYTYYSVSVVLYEAIVISAYMLLLVESLASVTQAGTTQAALLKKDKSKLPFPFCCWRYRPTKAYFMHTIKWSVMQYTIVQPAICVISVITQAFNLLCVQSFSPEFANVYLTVFALLSNSYASFFLSYLFYELTKRDLKGRRPGAKFWCVNIIVTIPFIQQLLATTKFWTSTNVANGLNALTLCIEMVFFSLFMWWAFPVSEYEHVNAPRRSAWRALLDSINFWDFVVETWRALKFFVDFAFDKPGARSHSVKPKPTYGGGSKFWQVFGSPSAKIGEGWNRISRLTLAGVGRSRRGTDASGSTQSTEALQEQVSMKELEASGSPFLEHIEPLTYHVDLEMTETRASGK